MGEILGGILNIIKSGFIVLGQKISKILSSAKKDDHNHGSHH